jgi:endonuclease/exonuclease/phosphatase family metal-dependent hydrolase
MASGAAAARHHLTVMTYNIAHARLSPRGLADMARVVRSARPDVVAVQEVDRSWSRSGSVDQAIELGRLLGMYAEFDADLDCAWPDLDGDAFCQYGTAILSRRPFLAGSRRHYVLPTPSDEEPRGLARTTIRVGGRPVDLFNTQLSFVESTRVRQVAVLKRILRRDRRAFVMAGDFNALPFYEEMVSLRRVTRDSLIVAGRPYLRTTALTHPVRLDNIFLPRPPLDGPRQRLLASRARVIYRPRVSDHRPLIVRVTLPW